MKITVQRPCAVLRLFAGLFFLFITFAATAGNPDDWENNAATSIANENGGDGTSFENPILIANAGELAYFAQQVNAGGEELTVSNGGNIIKDKTYGFLGYYFALSDDIDLKGNDWTPIGNGTTPFRAHFDGKGYKVKGMKVKIESDRQDESVFAGLFGNVINGTLQNLGVELADDGIEAASTGNYVYAGGIAGQIQGYEGDATLRNCYVEGTGAIKITGTGSGNSAYAGGIAGLADAAGNSSSSLTLTNCYATVDVEATASGRCEVGGIAGYVSGTLSYTYATGKVMVKGGTEQYAGGICGYYSGGGELSHNLALNKSVDGSGDNIHRIASSYSNTSTGLNYFSNYANPGVNVNSNAVFASTPDSQDGGNTSLEDFESVLKNAPSDDNAWVFPEGNLPQLRMATDEGKGAPSFADWPAGSQTDYLASNYLDAFIWSDYAATSIANAGGGDGTSFDNPILIANAEELAYFARQVNDGGKELTVSNGGSITKDKTSNTTGFSSYYFALSADIDLKGKNWMPIGYSGSATFCAHFDGKGHKVKGLKVKIESDDMTTSVFAGLFGKVINGTLQNLGVELAADGIKAASTGNYVYAGGIVGSNVAATLRNCYVEGKGAIKITGIGAGKGAYAGGIAGFASAAGTGSLTLTNCYATVEVEVEVEAMASADCYVGGIAGYASGTLSYTYATGNVWAQGRTEQYAGGICGYYSGGGELSHNLALNKNVYGDGNGDNIHRIAGYLLNPGSSTLYSNYANPGVEVNYNAVFASTPDSQDGGNTSLEDFDSVLKNAPSNDNAWSTAWVFPEGNLPQLRMATDDGKGTPSFEDWTAGSQTDYLASNYLNAFIWSDYAATSIANAGGGDGTKIAEPILIASAEELAYFARQVNNGGKELTVSNGGSITKDKTSNTTGFSSYYFALSADIDLKGKNWMPIGKDGATFRAHFDGKGHKVKGLKVKIKSDGTTTDVYAGLFGYVINGTLQNLGVELADDGIEAASTDDHVYAGGIAGRIKGYDGAATLRNCYVEGNGTIKIAETGSGYSVFAGGIAGSADAVINSSSSLILTNCYATVDVEAMASDGCCVGGIAGIALGTLSYTYATGYVWAKGGTRQYAGGICGYYSSGDELSHNLALNESVDGTGDKIYRIASSYNPTGLNYLSNYVNPAMLLNGNLANSYDADSPNGADTYRETVREDLAGISPAAAGWEEAWDWTDGTRSPRLKLVEEATDGSLSYPGTLLAGQLPNDAFGTLTALPLLHLTQATGGTLSVTAGQPATPLNDGDAVRPGTPLTLSYSTGTNYFFEGFFSGTGQGSVDTPLGGSTVEMPRADLWLRASFRYEAPTPPEPVYYTVTLPSVEGVTTDPAAGSHQVESWDNFRFYLTLDAAYDQSVPVVMTDDGKTITPRTSDGAYVLKNVRSDLSVTISGIVKNPPVANEPVASTATRIFTRDGRLFITADRPMQAQVVALTGRLARSLALTAGTTRIDALSPGIYLVRLDNGTVEKVIVRR